jgi:hypothetical protein
VCVCVRVFQVSKYVYLMCIRYTLNTRDRPVSQASKGQLGKTEGETKNKTWAREMASSRSRAALRRSLLRF